MSADLADRSRRLRHGRSGSDFASPDPQWCEPSRILPVGPGERLEYKHSYKTKVITMVCSVHGMNNKA
jgi:hypothetical protein